MRINVYAEELTDETELITKEVNDKCADCDGSGIEPQNQGHGNVEYLGCSMCEATGKVNHRTFYGIRMYLHSPEQLHYSPENDDRSAITFWVPWTKKHGHDWPTLDELFHNLGCLNAQACNESQGIPYEKPERAK